MGGVASGFGKYYPLQTGGNTQNSSDLVRVAFLIICARADERRGIAVKEE